jgi:hypothetical protein
VRASFTVAPPRNTGQYNRQLYFKLLKAAHGIDADQRKGNNPYGSSLLTEPSRAKIDGCPLAGDVISFGFIGISEIARSLP